MDFEGSLMGLRDGEHWGWEREKKGVMCLKFEAVLGVER